MEGSTNKETFKLLQISDDSKSLSDLDLPEFVTQRKRKVRRKTRPKPSTHERHHELNNVNQCNRLTLWLAIFLTSCWLLTLSYMIAVIHAENLRLEVQIKKLTITTQNLPDALQKWHETSKNLEQNQTIIYEKIFELQHSIENLNGDLTQYKNKLLNDKKDFSKDEKFVADFGAKIEAVAVDVESMKEKFSEFQKNQDSFKNDVIKLKSNFTNVLNKAAVITNDKTINYSGIIENLKTQTHEKIDSLSVNISTINDVINQKIKGLDDELVNHKKRLDELTDSSENTTSHVTSIEKDWTEYKIKFGQYEIFKNEVKTKIIELKNVTIDLDTAISELRSTCNRNYIEFMQNLEQFNKEKKLNSSQIILKADNEELSNSNNQNNNKNTVLLNDESPHALLILDSINTDSNSNSNGNSNGIGNGNSNGIGNGNRNNNNNIKNNNNNNNITTAAVKETVTTSTSKPPILM